MKTDHTYGSRSVYSTLFKADSLLDDTLFKTLTGEILYAV